MSAAVLFDLDRTLIDCNSGRLWMHAEWSAGRLGWFDVAWGAWWVARYSLGMEAGLEHAFTTAVATLEGASEAEFVERTEAWFVERVVPRLRPGAATAIEMHRAQGAQLVLATSGTVYAARAASRAFGLDVALGTVLEVEDGRFTGQIACMGVGAAKRTLVEAWAGPAGVDLQTSTFYTDSVSDVALLEAVGHPVVVNPDRLLRRRAATEGWPVVDWGRA